MLLGINATGSTGNSYFLKANNGEILLLDAGISIGDIKRGINYEVGSVVACLITHQHL
jgi:glyoxylase-like metal-dependent hydrolase (beta-lactamase superfamily II)